MIVACHSNMSSPVGPAELLGGGSLPRSWSSLLIRFKAMATHATKTRSFTPLRRRTFFFPVFRTAATESMSRNLGLPKNAEGQGLKPLRVSQIGYGAWPLR